MSYYSNFTLREEYFGGIIYNSQGNLFFLDDEQTRQIKSYAEFGEGLQYDTLQLLLKEKFINREGKVNRQTLIKNETNEMYLSAPISIHYYPSYWCNQKCTFCYKPNSNEIIDREKLVELRPEDFDVNVVAQYGVNNRSIGFIK